MSTYPIATIKSLSHDGRGVAHIDNKVHFVSNALPSEEVSVKVIKKRRDYNEAVAQEHFKLSPYRVEPLCPHFSMCGGCSLQHINVEHQIAFKQAHLASQLEQVAKADNIKWLPAISADIWGYRSKARLGVRYVPQKQKVLIGFREKYSNKVVDSNSCLILDSRVSLLIPKLSELIQSLSIYDKVAQIELATSYDKVVLVLRNLEPLATTDKDKIIEFINCHQVEVLLQPKGPDSIMNIDGSKKSIEPLCYELPEYNLKFNFNVMDFTQVNYSINKKMVSQAIDFLDLKDTDVVLDLFCGLGNFSLPIATKAKIVVGVEGDANMVARASSNAALNNITNAQFFCADLQKITTDINWLDRNVNKVLIDPPRSGAQDILPEIISIKPEKIVYVSCNSSTLVKDAAYLLQHGYELSQVVAINMFAHTLHLEAMAEFRLKK